eukprot:m.570451 g.570451  ORF g.570451 m.570451 type:complete len:72 (-) comp22263_c3_seq22:2040-2255(-)
MYEMYVVQHSEKSHLNTVDADNLHKVSGIPSTACGACISQCNLDSARGMMCSRNIRDRMCTRANLGILLWS